MSREQAGRIFQRLEPMMQLMEFSDAMGTWNDENQIRLAKMFGLECEVELKPVSNGRARHARESFSNGTDLPAL